MISCPAADFRVLEFCTNSPEANSLVVESNLTATCFHFLEQISPQIADDQHSYLWKTAPLPPQTHEKVSRLKTLYTWLYTDSLSVTHVLCTTDLSLGLLCHSFPKTIHMMNERFHGSKVDSNMKKTLKLGQNCCMDQWHPLLLACRREFTTLNP